jgi:exodeoxyribonuclease-3
MFLSLLIPLSPVYGEMSNGWYDAPMKLVSWNVNGLRSLSKNGYWNAFIALAGDILCLQEIKAEPSQLPEEMCDVPGYHAFFNPSRARKGYSGVALYSKTMPEEVSDAMGGEERFDIEGRLLTAHYRDFILCNVYFPNGGRLDRLEYKLDFYDAFLVYVESLRAKHKKGVIICGDFNVAHEEIDLARPKENEEHTGFLPEERAWMDELIAHGYVDAYRHFNPGRAGVYTYWDQYTHARDRNVGWRIDYFLVSTDILPRVERVDVHSSIFGSDHCPVSLVLKDNI